MGRLSLRQSEDQKPGMDTISVYRRRLAPGIPHSSYAPASHRTSQLLVHAFLPQGAGAVSVIKPPVFVVGSARSGTTLLYHSLLSSGGFADYRTEPAVFDL